MWMTWMCNDNEKSRGRLWTIFILYFICTLLNTIFLFLYGFDTGIYMQFRSYGELAPFAIGALVLNGIVYGYWASVCKRYAAIFKSF